VAAAAPELVADPSAAEVAFRRVLAAPAVEEAREVVPEAVERRERRWQR
jgi:hypothetical protein